MSEATEKPYNIKITMVTTSPLPDGGKVRDMTIDIDEGAFSVEEFAVKGFEYHAAITAAQEKLAKAGGVPTSIDDLLKPGKPPGKPA